jgi:hypothetical protein
VVKKEPINRTVAASDERILKAAYVETFYTLFASIPAAKKFDIRVRVVRKHVNNLAVSEYDGRSTWWYAVPLYTDICLGSSHI